MDGVDDGEIVGVFIEGPEDGAGLGGSGEKAALLEGLGEPGAEDGGVERDGVAADWDGGVGLLIGGEEDAGTAGDVQEARVLGGRGFRRVRARGHGYLSPWFYYWGAVSSCWVDFEVEARGKWFVYRVAWLGKINEWGCDRVFGIWVFPRDGKFGLDGLLGYRYLIISR